MEATGDDWLLATLKVDVVSLENAFPAFSASQLADTGESVSAVESSGFGRVVEIMVCVDVTGRSCVGSPSAIESMSSNNGKPAYSHPGRSQGFKRSIKSSSRSSYDSGCSGGEGDNPGFALWSEGYRKIGSARRQFALARKSSVGWEDKR
jgi:hypothetical protein